MTIADLQALPWSAEKHLYDAGISEVEITDGYDEDVETPDFANAAATLARSKGISNDVIQGALARVGGVGATDERAGGAGDEEMLRWKPRTPAQARADKAYVERLLQ